MESSIKNYFQIQEHRRAEENLSNSIARQRNKEIKKEISQFLGGLI